jgi:hypothetical protein
MAIGTQNISVSSARIQDSAVTTSKINDTAVTLVKLNSDVTGTSANKLVKLDASAKLPAVDGSNLTNLTSGKCTLLGAVLRTAGDVAITSTTFTDVTGCSITATTGANRVMLIASGTWYESSTDRGCLDVDIDGTREGSTQGLIQSGNMSGVSLSFCLVHVSNNTLTAAQHTFKLQARNVSESQTLTLRGTATETPLAFQVLEIA